MATGRLEITGTIAVDQFWPTGASDADTTKILVSVGPGGFRFRLHPAAPWQPTTAFDNATVVGRIRKPAIDSHGRITVRLQGIDATELHYRPPAALRPSQRTQEQHDLYLQWNEEYRQHLAETATVELKTLLQQVGQDPVACTVFTAVDFPDEVFDTYGRFVGDILVTVGGTATNINTWLVQHGWAFPAFYNSMAEDEITTLTNAGDDAWINDRGVWPELQEYVGALDWNLRYRRPSSSPVHDPVADTGPVILPKLFRRLSTWAVNRRAKMVTGPFFNYLRDRRDQVMLTDDFLAQGPAAVVWQLDDFVHADGFFELWPEDLVFREAASRLIGPGGAEITW
jgi:endonuclease YncB( thermonuclease family)